MTPEAEICSAPPACPPDEKKPVPAPPAQPPTRGPSSEGRAAPPFKPLCPPLPPRNAFAPPPPPPLLTPGPPNDPPHSGDDPAGPEENVEAPTSTTPLIVTSPNAMSTGAALPTNVSVPVMSRSRTTYTRSATFEG